MGDGLLGWLYCYSMVLSDQLIPEREKLAAAVVC